MRHSKILLTLILGFLFLLFLPPTTHLQAQEIDETDFESWQADWGLPEGFAMEIDTRGYIFPSSMAFVPEPGDEPDDPLYFVGELRGTIKVVTNDRSVHIFTEHFLQEYYSNRGLNDIPDEFGLTGLCLDPKHGYLFATMTHQNEDGRFNDIMRFKSVPRKFGLGFSNATSIGHVFEGVKTGFSHVVGPCQVVDDILYVGVGDGYNVNTLPIGPEIPAGKVLRMTLDGKPIPDNPFYNENDLDSAANYVWAYGFRNPFGLHVEGEKVFVGDNGNSLDRFLLAEKGEDYLWNGSDFSIGSKNLYSFQPTIGPTQLVLNTPEKKLFPQQYDNTFFMGMSGTHRGIINIPFTEDSGTEEAVPDIFLNYLNVLDNRYSGSVATLGLGPDGLYFAPITMIDTADMAVFRIYYDPENEHPFRQNEYTVPSILIEVINCKSCHILQGRGSGTAPDITPKILRPRFNKSLNSQGYLNWWAEVDAMDNEITKMYAGERQHLRELSGDERVWYWTFYHLLEPRFDNPEAAMPNFGLTEKQATSLADYFIGDLEDIQAQENATPTEEEAPPTQTISIMDRLRTLREKLPPVGYRDMAIVFVLGGLIGAGAFWIVIRKKSKSRK